MGSRVNIGQWVLVTILIFAMGCGAHVRNAERPQSPLYEVDEDVEVALVSIEVPDWVKERMPEGEEAPEVLLRRVIPTAFDGTSYDVVDRLDEGYSISIDPDSEPMIVNSVNFVGVVGEPYRYDANNHAQAYGVRPITWEVVSAPSNFELDEETGEIFWIPESEGEVSITLEASNELGEDRINFDVQVREEDDSELRTPRSPRISNTQEFVAVPPEEIPTSIEEPLVLAAHVVDWDESEFHDDLLGTHRRAETDVVYSVWTRDGEHIDTRRVRLSAVPVAQTSGEIAVVPDWPQWYHDSWRASGDTRPTASQDDDDRIFAHAAEVNAIGFAFPFGTRQARYTSMLYDDDAHAEGVELMDQEDWAGAYDAFLQVVEEDPEDHGAHFNLGVAAELMGDDAQALQHLRRAYEINDRGTFRRHIEIVERREEMRRNITGEVTAAREAFEAQLAAEEATNEMPGDDIADEDVDQFADAIKALKELEEEREEDPQARMEAADTPQERQELQKELMSDMEEAAEGAGMSFQEFLMMSQRLHEDPEFRKRVEEHVDISDLGGASPPPQ